MNSSLRDSAQDLLQKLHLEQRAANDLLKALQQEQMQLVALETEQLAALSGEKNRLINQLTTLTASRYAVLRTLDHAPNEDGMRAWLAKTAGTAVNTAAAKVWQDLMTVAEAGKEINRINGILISKQLTRNQAALNVLRGASDSSATNFYGPDGQSSLPNFGQRHITG